MENDKNPTKQKLFIILFFILLVNDDNTGKMMFVQETRTSIHSSMQTGNV